ncbi:MAG: transcriptional repressor [Chloroflexi bacterium HGW-Chloroflexi-3]|nr:MAG: transcriptional repressor [Chloroflexi bacterium HGW-Chloroflexi-3]
MKSPMNDPNDRFNELIAALKDRGYRMTPQRLELVRVITTSEGHPSASQIYETIRNQFPTMSQATVYNTLSLLKEMNQILEIDLHDDSHYDGNRPEPHPHIICIQCNRIVDGNFDLDGNMIQRLEETSGFHIIRSQFAFYGLCPNCRSKEKASVND